jgi:hypothetical protein
MAQNVAQTTFLTKLIHDLYLGKKLPQILGYLPMYFIKMPKVNNHPLGEFFSPWLLGVKSFS